MKLADQPALPHCLNRANCAANLKPKHKRDIGRHCRACAIAFAARPWSPEEDKIIFEGLARKLSCEKISRYMIPSRGRKAVERRIRALIGRRKPALKPKTKQKPKTVVVHEYKPIHPLASPEEIGSRNLLRAYARYYERHVARAAA